MSHQPHIQIIDMPVLMAVYLSGFKSGVASTTRTFTGNDTAAQHLSERVLTSMYDDPVTMLELENQIHEILAGVDSGEIGWRLPLSDPPGGVADA